MKEGGKEGLGDVKRGEGRKVREWERRRGGRGNEKKGRARGGQGKGRVRGRGRERKGRSTPEQKFLYTPSIGMTSGIGGIVSPTISRNTTRASRIVVSRLTLSPDSTGRKKPRNEMTKIRKQGAMRLTT